MEWFQKAVDAGYVGGMTAIGFLYLNGKGVPKDGKRALEWFKKAAELEDPVAMDAIGDMYYYGVEMQ